MKGALKSQIPDMDEDMISNTKYRYNAKSSFYLPVMNVRHDDIKVSDSLEGDENDSCRESLNVCIA